MLFHNFSASVPDVGPTVFQHCVNSPCKPSHTGQAFPTAYRTNNSVKSRIPQGSDGLISPYSCAHLGQVHVEMGLTCIDFQSRPPNPRRKNQFQHSCPDGGPLEYLPTGWENDGISLDALLVHPHIRSTPADTRRWSSVAEWHACVNNFAGSAILVSM